MTRGILASHAANLNAAAGVSHNCDKRDDQGDPRHEHGDAVLVHAKSLARLCEFRNN